MKVNWHLAFVASELIFHLLNSFSVLSDIILFPDEYNSILKRTEINVPEIPKMFKVKLFGIIMMKKSLKMITLP